MTFIKPHQTAKSLHFIAKECAAATISHLCAVGDAHPDQEGLPQSSVWFKFLCGALLNTHIIRIVLNSFLINSLWKNFILLSI